MRSRSLAIALALALLAPLPLRAATITIINADGPGEGFNDPTAVSPVGGNNGTTLGQQRLLAFQHVAGIWGSIVQSDVEVVVKATFDPLDCDSTSGVLGSAGPVQIFSDFPGAPLQNTWYPVALANKLAGEDLAPPPGSEDNPHEDLRARFNSTVGKSTCLGGRNWYYGFDGASGSKIDLIVVLLHEMGHGLGFINLVDEDTGEFFMDIPDVASTFTLDTSTGLHWTQMSNLQRQASATNDGNLVWDGGSTTDAAGALLDGPNIVQINAPDAIKGTFQAGNSLFGADLTVGGVTGIMVLATDAANGEGPLTSDACTALTNAAQVAGRITLVDRGTCTFLQKAKNVQQAGAIALVIANDQPGSPFTIGSGDATITIPLVSITQADGATIKAQLAGGVNATLRVDPTRLAGADGLSRMKLYAPNPVEPGSSISHWDTSATPNLLMEPSINSDLDHGVDLTENAFIDIGWFTAPAPPSISASNQASLTVDRDRDGLADPGDTIHYTAVITNSGGEATGLRYDSTLDSNTQLVADSAHSTSGTVTTTPGSVSVNVGTLGGGDSVTVTFDTVVSPSLASSVPSVSNQGSASGSNFTTVSSSDPAVGGDPLPTVTPISHTPIRAFKTAQVFDDTDHNGGLTRGETIRYTITVENFGASSVSGVVFTDTPDPNSVLVNGSVATSKGTVVSGNGSGHSSVTVNIGTLPPGASETVTLRVRTSTTLPATVTVISNQGSVAATGLGPILTDDPNGTGSGNPTRLGFSTGRKRAARRN